jgi:hypothetical protein
MGAKKEILQEGLDAAGKAVTGLPTAVNPSDAVPLSQMQAGDAAVLATIPALATAAAADIDATAGTTGTGPKAAHEDHKHKVLTGTPVATGTANAAGAGPALAAFDHVHQTSFAGVAAALAAASTDVSLNNHKLTTIADGTGAQDAAAFHQIGDAISAAGGTVANEAALAATNAGDGQFRVVATYRDLFQLDKNNVRTAIPGVVVQSTVNPLWWWVRRNSPDPSWATQAKWYWSDSGNDENDGATISTPFKTHEEFFRRTNGLTMSATIIVLGSIPNQTCRLGCRGSVTYKAPLIPIAGSSSSFTSRPSNRSPAANTAYNLTDTAIAASWTAGNGATSYVNKILVARNAGVVVGTCFVDRDLTAKTMRPCPVSNAIPVLAENDTIPVPTVAGTLSSGNTYDVYDLTSFSVTGITSSNPTTTVSFYGLNFTSSFTPAGMSSFVPTHCYFTALLTINGPRYQPHQCVNAGGLTINAMSSVGFPHFHTVRGTMILQTNLWTCPDELVLSGGGFYLITAGNMFSVTDFGIFDGGQFQIIQASQLRTGGYLWGDNNGGSTVLILSTIGDWWFWNPLTPPSITGAAAPISLNNVGRTLAEIVAGPITYPHVNSGIAAIGS